MSSEEHERTNDSQRPPDAEEPIVARLADETVDLSPTESDDFELTTRTNDESIRVGSPFAVDPTPISGTSIQRRLARPEAFYDVGPLRYTAMGAVAAATLVLGFAAAAAWWFPGGGTIIAALGCALSIFGLYSNKRLAASGCLLLHLVLFMICYSRAIDV